MMSRYIWVYAMAVMAVVLGPTRTRAVPVASQPSPRGQVRSGVSGSLVKVTLADREKCQPGDVAPAVRVNTTVRVANLREEMDKYNLTAYIIPSGDEHQSEYVAKADERRKYISGFSGSSGLALVTLSAQALWTDGRYFLQAEDELDCAWIIMKEGLEGVPTVLEWLKELPMGATVGADPRLIGAQTWQSYAEELEGVGIDMLGIGTNLVDVIWEEDGRPPYVQDPVFVHEIEFAGKSWQDKVADVRGEMSAAEADVLVLTALDEVAWLLNLRGSDIPYNPVFRAYVAISTSSVDLFLPESKTTESVEEHLSVNECSEQQCVTIHDYASILDYLKDSPAEKIMVPGSYAYSGGASYAIYSAVEESARVTSTSPVLLMKARKNEVEIAGMKNAHLKDAVALCDFLRFLEKEITAGANVWTEISAATELRSFRAAQEDFVGLSFASISAYSSNGAVIHYEPTDATDRQIGTGSLFLLDSGAQYKDGTTDVTRTMHYGEPTDEQIEAYTRVLAGHVDLASVVFPEGTTDTRLDVLARRHLYEIGLDYRHGTGHGIGMFLGVHESLSPAYEPGYFDSNEPGFYKDNEYGIRLENIMVTVRKTTPYTFDKPSLGFEPVTLVPFERKLINETLLSRKQCEWLNNYHATVLQLVGDELNAQGKGESYEWLEEKTRPLCAGALGVSASSSFFLIVSALLVVLRSQFLF
ncbi:xaa-Pro aminopeptidase 1-like isoform X2 [Penaeus monodon]|uniref:xaa-Pro aminopeptidase 1-like isoform X2 n=1 Tax=Penaeus monodon TaxID=6687 RepID=UPI0018A7DA66|nr:xaa-Pro aminopeptidase 1-like isoform X2 [Penaeus monodon]